MRAHGANPQKDRHPRPQEATPAKRSRCSPGHQCEYHVLSIFTRLIVVCGGRSGYDQARILSRRLEDLLVGSPDTLKPTTAIPGAPGVTPDDLHKMYRCVRCGEAAHHPRRRRHTTEEKAEQLAAAIKRAQAIGHDVNPAAPEIRAVLCQNPTCSAKPTTDHGHGAPPLHPPPVARYGPTAAQARPLPPTPAPPSSPVSRITTSIAALTVAPPKTNPDFIAGIEREGDIAVARQLFTAPADEKGPPLGTDYINKHITADACDDVWFGPEQKSALAGRQLCPGLYELMGLRAVGGSGKNHGAYLASAWAQELRRANDGPFLIVFEAVGTAERYYGEQLGCLRIDKVSHSKATQRRVRDTFESICNENQLATVMKWYWSLVVDNDCGIFYARSTHCDRLFDRV